MLHLTSSTLATLIMYWAKLRWNDAIHKGTPHKFYHNHIGHIAGIHAMERHCSQSYASQNLPWSH